MERGPYSSAWICALALVPAAGCGGGQSGPPSADATLHTSHAGDAVFSYFGQPKPQLTTSSGAVTVVGQAGAVFSTVTLEPPPNLLDTYIVTDRSVNGGYGLYVLPWSTGTPQLLFASTQNPFNPTISAYG